MNFKWIKNELVSNKNWIIIWISKLCRISLNSQFLSIKGTTIGITVWLRVCPTPVRAITWHPKFFSWSKFHNETECCILGFFLSEFYLYLYRVFGGGKIISQNDVIGRLITPFVLIYHTVYCWGFKLSLKKSFFGDACRSTLIWFFSTSRVRDTRTIKSVMQ